MKTTQNDASQVILSQHATILQAIEMLQKVADGITSSCDPDTANWGYVANAAQGTDVARYVIESMTEDE